MHFTNHSYFNKMQHLETIKSNFVQHLNGKQTSLHILENANGVKVGICNYGARITHFITKNSKNELVDIVLGFNSIEEYINANERYHGVTVGPFANRIANGTFQLHHKNFQLEKNNGGNCLHGGSVGFHDKVWDIIAQSSDTITLSIKTAANEGGFPGELAVSIKFSLNDKNELWMEYFAESANDTVINLTNHAYFNLNGEGDVLQHEVKIAAEQFAVINENCIPTGALRKVAHTAFDFTRPKVIAKDIYASDEQLQIGKGYDHSFELKAENNDQLVFAASAAGNISGIQLDVYTTEPAMQFYTGNYLGGNDTGKTGEAYQDRFGFCFETQHHPDTPNQSKFPSSVLNAGEKFYSKTMYKVN